MKQKVIELQAEIHNSVNLSITERTSEQKVKKDLEY